MLGLQDHWDRAERFLGRRRKKEEDKEEEGWRGACLYYRPKMLSVWASLGFWLVGVRCLYYMLGHTQKGVVNRY